MLMYLYLTDNFTHSFYTVLLCQYYFDRTIFTRSLFECDIDTNVVAVIVLFLTRTRKQTYALHLFAVKVAQIQEGKKNYITCTLRCLQYLAVTNALSLTDILVAR
jgi:hypothetical protein